MEKESRGSTWVSADHRSTNTFYPPPKIDEPKTASAAQMASRNMRNAKSKRRAAPLASLGVPQSMDFGASSATGAPGGMFGSSVQAGVNSFNFKTSGPAAPSFPLYVGKGLYGGKPTTSEGPEDARADTTGEEAARRNRPFSMQYGSPAITSSSSSAAPTVTQQSNPFAQSQTPATASASGDEAARMNRPFTMQYGSPAITSSSSFTTPAVTQQSNPFAQSQPSAFAPTFAPFPSFGSTTPLASSDTEMAEPNLASTHLNNPGNAGSIFGGQQQTAPSTSNPFASLSAPTTQPSTAQFSSPFQPAQSLFGTSQPSAPMYNAFTGLSTSTTQPSTTQFSSPFQPAQSLFGTSQPSAPTYNAFASLSTPTTQPSTTQFSSPFQSVESSHGTSQPSAPTYNAFAGPSTLTTQPSDTQLSSPFKLVDAPFGQQTAPSSGLFAHLNTPTTQTSTENSFSPFKSTYAPYGTSHQTAPTPSIFANLNTPITQPSTETLSSPFQMINTPSNSNEQAVTSSDQFAAINSPISQAAQFPSFKPVDALPGASQQTASSPSLFANFSAPDTQASIKSSFTPIEALSSTSQQTAPPFNPLANLNTAATQVSTASPAMAVDAPSSPSQQTAPSTKLFAEFNAPAAQVSAVSPLKQVNAPSSAEQLPPPKLFPSSQTTSKSSNASTKPKAPEAVIATSGRQPSPSKALVHIDGNNTSEVDHEFTYSESSLTDEALAPLVPSLNDSQKAQFYTAYRIRSLKQCAVEYFASTPLTANLSKFNAFYGEKWAEIYAGSKRKFTDGVENENPSKRSRQILPPKSNIFQAQSTPKRQFSDDRDVEEENTQPAKRSRPLPTPSSTPAVASSMKSKRKAEVQLTKDDYEKEEQEGRKVQAPPINGDDNGSSTSNIFKGIVQSPAKATPVKKLAPLRGAPSSTNDSSPRDNPFGVLSVPKSPTKASAPASEPPMNLFAPKLVPSTNATKSFGQQPGPSVSKSTPALFTNTSALSGQKPSFNVFASAQSLQEPTTNTFAPKTTSTESKSSTPQANSTISGPPKFGAPASNVNFMAQFAAKAKDTEKSAMAKAMEEDLDSDDDEETKEQWKVEYLAKRKAEREEYEKIAKRSRGFVLGGKESETGSASSSNSRSASATPVREENSHSPATSSNLFAQIPQSAGNSGFDSGSSTPIFGRSGTGSVLDGHDSDRPVLSDGANIFGHLTPDPASGIQDNASSESDGEEDSENKDPNYIPDDESAGPGTPVEETGPGIASAKKAPKGLMERITGYADEGSGIPKRNFTDLINENNTKDANGNYIRRLSPENDENTEPAPKASSLFASLARFPPPTTLPEKDANAQSTAFVPPKPFTTNHFAGLDGPKAQSVSIFNSPFAGLNKAPATGADNTWKHDSPIKFGSSSSSPNDGGNPKFSITEATPSKSSTPSLFAGLNSNPKPAFSNLFGSQASKASASATAPGTKGTSFSGFGLLASPSTSALTAPTLGAPSSAGFSFGSNSGTQFLSTGASGATSRATSPGNTTDGASDYEEPENEKHEQLDLTSGGPGEENEDELHKVRAKALQFMAGENGSASSWVSKGVGPLRVLKHKDTGAVRVVLRQDPSGKVIINKALLSKVEYKQNDKTVRFPAAGDDGGLETWLLQVKEKDWAEKLAAVFEANK